MAANLINYSKENIEKILESNDVEKVTDALLYLTFNIDDFDWVQDTILRMISNLEEDISGLAITCVGHLARIYSKIDKDKIIPCLQLKAKDKRFEGRVGDALDDINMFAK
ncbi:hypothetical protein [Gilliamella apicola]|uniref:hypothetical protein n=1 Tax=Gilliamella apicola TaxID=1196095 RepID=UPI000A058C2B|nr:hypothetical protein [Gilliamella apicola]ORF43786.1 hypothetical protein B5800_13395 [Gilliamella apicola]ORF47199.1 hypothetical protein B5799_13440 [Gilliamella apicola]ORF48656.1 hypothetical protein B5803_11035 [Gilliamella apicola]ORF51059.1 hypothetical protein B5802_11860 [Gilliamella apicola]ORF51464.1 hypothetical protein B5798_13390 [Gilliamella apicola]